MSCALLCVKNMKTANLLDKKKKKKNVEECLVCFEKSYAIFIILLNKMFTINEYIQLFKLSAKSNENERVLKLIWFSIY